MNATRRNVCLSTARRWVSILAALIPCASPAAEYTLEPAVDVQQIYNDNIRLTSAAHDSITGTTLSPRLNFAARTQAWQLGGETRLRGSRYRGIEGLDTTDRIINLNSQYQTERNALQLGGGRGRESILTNPFIDLDTGLVKTQVDRINDNATASWTWSLTEKDQMKLDYQYTEVAYDDTSTTSLYDYSQRGPSVSLSHQFSERVQFTLQGGSSRFTVPELSTSHLYLGKNSRFASDGDPRNLSLESVTNNFQVGINYMLAQTVTGNLKAGSRKTTSDYLNETCEGGIIDRIENGVTYGTCTRVKTSTITTTGHSTVYSASLTKKTETLQLTAGASRSIDPSGSGTQVQRDTLNLSAQWSQTERLAFSISGANIEVRAIENTLAVTDRRLYNIVPGMQWRAGHNTVIKLSYNYTHLSYVGVADPVSSQQVSLTFSYTGDKISISR